LFTDHSGEGETPVIVPSNEEWNEQVEAVMIRVEEQPSHLLEFVPPLISPDDDTFETVYSLTPKEEEEPLPSNSFEALALQTVNLIDSLIACRLCHYGHTIPDTSIRRDIICLCCSRMYRPDFCEDDLNCLVCSNCIRTLQEAGG
jgi:hypothetical protein